MIYGTIEAAKRHPRAAVDNIYEFCSFTELHTINKEYWIRDEDIPEKVWHETLLCEIRRLIRLNEFLGFRILTQIKIDTGTTSVL